MAVNNIEMLYKMDHAPECKIRQLILTPRGAEVLQLSVTGMSGREIGKKLGISFSAVKRHKEKMLLANSCTSIQDLIAVYYAAANTEKP